MRKPTAMLRCACGIILEGRRFLLGRRSADRAFYPGVWHLLGGHCEGAESPAEALFGTVYTV